ncbi:MAG: cbb3-type cytochrome oxidase assembly protein CcoS [Armatimonadetes bacterium]|nr:cbb3-type cytochrome oxidase assembly protein CcoS [Armatimonadota bacterium]
MSSIWFMLAAGAAMGTIALVAFLWGVKNGAFENAEDAKYIVFRDEDEDEE